MVVVVTLRRTKGDVGDVLKLMLYSGVDFWYSYQD
jgi:hypothetical protein